LNYIGIDPGQRGGLARITPGSIDVWPMPRHDAEEAAHYGTPIDWNKVYRLLSHWEPAKKTTVVIEKVHAFTGQGVSSTFKFGANYGGLLGILGAMSADYILVVPRTWKKIVLGANYEHDKLGTIAFLRHQYPTVNLLATPRSKKPHDGMADALAIAHYGFKKQT
jgi:Holliday junction resolvasome RuvABC endonuclease subunit